MSRRDIKEAPYNPRFIGEKAKEKLRRMLGDPRFGLLAPITVNKTNNIIVGGHQRIHVLDLLEGGKDYQLDVAQVELSEKDEMAANIFLNNTEAQGDYDLVLLEKMYKEYKVDFEDSGFDAGAIYRMFGDNPLVEQPEKLVEFSEKIREAQERYKGIQNSNRDEYEFFLIFVFKDNAMRDFVTDSLSLPTDKYQDGHELLKLLTPEHIKAGEELKKLREQANSKPADEDDS